MAKNMFKNKKIRPLNIKGLVRPGWCSADWDLTLWREVTAWDEVLDRLEHDPDYIDFVVDNDYNHSY